MPTLTTVIPVYNGEKYLATTLRSVYAQIRLPDRVIVLDNCSTDGTRAIFETFHERGCEWRQNEKNIGLFGNFNAALGFAAETDFLHLLMADDLIRPEFYEKIMAALAGAFGTSMGYSYNQVIDGEGNVTGPLHPLPCGPPRIRSHRDYLGNQAALNTILLPAAVFKTDRKPPVCLFRDMPQVADILFLAEWAAHCSQIIEAPEYLCQYRLHPTNSTSGNIFNLRYWVLDEWTVISTVLAWIKEPQLIHWIRAQKLKCLFAARGHMKAEMMKNIRPAYAREIRQAVSSLVGPAFGLIGRTALWLRDRRDRFKGRPTGTEEKSGLVGLSPAKPK